MTDIPISEFGIKNVEAAYGEVKTSLLFAAPTSVVILIAAVLLFVRAYRVVNAASEKANIDMRMVVGLCWVYAVFMAVILLLPVMLYGIELFLADMSDKAITALGGEPKGPIDTALAEMEEMERRYPDGVSFFFNSITEIMAYYNALVVKPFLSIFIRYLFALFITFRYAYLLLLELTFPIAFIMLLDDKRAANFEKWATYFVICYLMIPAFLIGNALADRIYISIFGNSYTFLGILAQFVLKLFLLKKMTDAVFKSI